jgi:prefoldin subunit 5
MENADIRQIRRMMKRMTYISEHLSSLRQEITDLRNMNARYSSKSEHGPLDQSALETRTNRLRQIKQELSNMLDRPTDPKVWWEKLRKPSPIA